MAKDDYNNQHPEINRNNEHNFINNSHVSNAITDEEFSDEFLAYPADPGAKEASFQFDFLGAELEKINLAKQTKYGLKERQP